MGRLRSLRRGSRRRVAHSLQCCVPPHRIPHFPSTPPHRPPLPTDCGPQHRDVGAAAQLCQVPVPAAPGHAAGRAVGAAARAAQVHGRGGRGGRHGWWSGISRLCSVATLALGCGSARPRQPTCAAAALPLPPPSLPRHRFLLGESDDALYVCFMGTKLPRDMAANLALFQASQRSGCRLFMPACCVGPVLLEQAAWLSALLQLPLVLLLLPVMPHEPLTISCLLRRRRWCWTWPC